MKSESNFRPVPSVDRSLDLLELLSRHKEGIGFNEIIAQLGIPKSSLSGLLRTLIARRYVSKTADGRRFRLGMKVLGLARGYVQDGDLLETAKQMLPRLVQEFGETAHIAVLDGRDAIYVASQSSQHSMSVNSPLGTRVPAYATAVGKSLLAMLPEQEIDRRFPALLEKRTSRTITSRVELKRELQQVRALGYAYDAEEMAVGLTCIAAPIFDAPGQAIASIGVSIPTARLKEMDTARIPFIVRGIAQEVSQFDYTPTAHWHPNRVKVAWSMATLKVEAYQIVYRTAEQLCAESPDIEVIWTDAREDATKQSVDVASLLALKPDVIIIHPEHALFANQLFNMAAQAGVPAINFQRPVRSRDVDCFIGGDTFKQGQMTARFVAQLLRGQGQCAMIEGDPYNDNARNFAQGVREELRSYPNLRLVADEPSLWWSAEKASELADTFLSEYGDSLAAIIVANDDMARGVADVIARYRLTDHVVLVGGDGDLEALERIRAGTQHGTAFQNWMELSRETLRLAVEIAHGTLDRSQLPLRSILNDPPGPPVHVKDLPYIFVDHSTLDVLERFWMEALKMAIPELLPLVPGTWPPVSLPRGDNRDLS